MPYHAILNALIDELVVTGAPVYVSWDKVQEWPVQALNKLLKAGILSPASAAQSIECVACEYRCFMDVIIHDDGRDSNHRAFIVCDVPEMQSQMGRIQIPLERLQQWKLTVGQMARAIAGLVDFDSEVNFKPENDFIRFAMLNSPKGRRWVSLNINSLVLELNGYEMPVQELLYFDDDELLIDRSWINDCLNRPSRKEGKPYKPSTDKREAGKLETQAKYQDWRDEYQRQKKSHPTKSDVWISKQIEKLPIAQGKSSDTIRKQMTK